MVKSKPPCYKRKCLHMCGCVISYSLSHFHSWHQMTPTLVSSILDVMGRSLLVRDNVTHLSAHVMEHQEVVEGEMGR